MGVIRLVVIISVVFACISCSSASQSAYKYVLGADFGTESVRVGIFDRRDGRLVDSHSIAYSTKYPANGFAEQNPSDWWSNFCDACNTIFKNGNCSPVDIGAISVDTTACSVVALDDKFRPLRPCLLWMDSRSSPQCAKIMEHAKGDSALQVNCGGQGPLSAEWMIPKALWLKEMEPATWAAAKYICEKQDFINFHLTGEYCASGCNVAARWHWDAEAACADATQPTTTRRYIGRPMSLLRKIQLEDIVDKWPERCVGMGDLVGAITEQASADTGLLAGTPVFQGGPDAYVGMVGLDCISTGKVAIITGSSHLHLSVCDPSTQSNGGFWGPYSGAPLRGLRFVEGGQSSTGSVASWFRRTLAPSASYKELDTEAEMIPAGSEGLLMMATFQGARTPKTDPLLKGAFVGLTFRHHRAHMWRSILEGVCFGTKAAMNALLSTPDTTQPASSTDPVMMAGGVTRSPVWLQMTSDVLGRDIVVGEMDNSPLLGCAILAAAGRELLDKEEDASATTQPRLRAEEILQSVQSTARKFVRFPRKVSPRSDVAAEYNKVFLRHYASLADHIPPVCHALATGLSSL